MSVLTTVRRLLNCSIQPHLVAGLGLRMSPFSPASAAFQHSQGRRENIHTCCRGFPWPHSSGGWVVMKSSVFSLQTGVPVVPARCVVNVSKRRGKKKTVKAVAKRFHRTGSGKLKYWPAGKVHNMLSKSRNHRQRLRKPRYASKTQLKTLNKMISGW